jgi:hypothetical protein
VNELSNTSDFTRPAPSFKDQCLLDGLIGRSVDDQDLSEVTGQKVIFYFTHFSSHDMCYISRPRMDITGLQRILAGTLSAIFFTTWEQFMSKNKCATSLHAGRLQKWKGRKLSLFVCMKNPRWNT